jgi:hypothetical protein
MTPKRLIVVVIALALLIAGYGAYWMHLANGLETATLDWIAARRADGYAIDHGEVSRGGFPDDVRIAIDGIRIAPPLPSDWAWEVERAAVGTSPFRPDRVRIAVGGHQELHLVVSGMPRTYAGTAVEEQAELKRGGWLPVGTVTVRDLVLVDDVSGDRIAVATGDLVTAGDPAAPSGPGTAGYEVRFGASGLYVPGEWPLMLGGGVDVVLLRASLMGALKEKPWPETLARWRDAGGTVEVARIDFQQGNFRMAGEGTFALDGDGQPIGAMTSRLSGWQPILAAFARRGLINKETATTVTMVLNGFAKNDADGVPVLSVPIRLQDRLLSAGPMPVVRLPRVDWLDGAAPPRER